MNRETKAAIFNYIPILMSCRNKLFAGQQVGPPTSYIVKYYVQTRAVGCSNCNAVAGKLFHTLFIGIIDEFMNYLNTAWEEMCEKIFPVRHHSFC